MVIALALGPLTYPSTTASKPATRKSTILIIPPTILQMVDGSVSIHCKISSALSLETGYRFSVKTGKTGPVPVPVPVPVLISETRF
jgi:hypothetical protein